MPNWDAAEVGMPPGVALGALSEHDLDDVLQIEAASFVTPWNRGHFQSVLRSVPAWNPVLRKAGRVVAYACTVAVGEELEVQNVAVSPAERGRGLGSFLLREVLQRARDSGCRVAHLEVRPSNAIAVRLYEKFGFRKTGRRRGYYESPAEDAILMSARLDDDPAGAGNEEDRWTKP